MFKFVLTNISIQFLDPWNWAKSVGNSWRTTNDIADNWDSFIRVLDNNIGLSFAAGPGGIKVK